MAVSKLKRTVSKPDKVMVACPHCGHSQAEPRGAFSTICKKCREHISIQEVSKKTTRKAAAEPAPLERKRVVCFDCGTELEVAPSAQSTMCKRCSSYIDLHDHHIAHAVSKNFKTKGSFVIEPKGYVFNTEATVGEAVIKGRFLGKLIAERSLTIYSSAEIKGTFTTARLVIPALNHFRWKELIKAGAAEIAGELAANLQVEGTLTLKSTARFFGNVHAKSLVVEAGAVLVGYLQIGIEKGQSRLL